MSDRFDHTLEHTLETKPDGSGADAVTAVRRIELITGAGRRRQWSDDDKIRIVVESLRPGINVSEVARRNGLTPQQLFGWRRKARALMAEAADDASGPERAARAAARARSGESRPSTGEASSAKSVPAFAGDRRSERCVAVITTTSAVARQHRDRYRQRGRAHQRPGRDGVAYLGGACRQESVMIMPGTELQVLVATRPIDFRKQADTLAAFVQEVLGSDPYCGAVYVFRAKRMDRVKLLWWDGTGICLLTKRLEGGTFRWPPIEDGVMRLTPGQLAALLEGTEWVRAAACEVERPRAAS